MLEFKTINESATVQIVEKKSKFIANIFYIENKEEAEEIIKSIKKKYFDARHNCFAYVTFDEENKKIERCSDDGEPSGTAGAPMLDLLRGNNLANVLVIVTRYFGGILLGTGGLVRAYSEATLNAINNCKMVIKELGKVVKVILEYKELEAFKYFCRKNNINIVNEQYENNVILLTEMSNDTIKKVNTDIDKMNFKILKLDIINEKYIIKNIDI